MARARWLVFASGLWAAGIWAVTRRGWVAKAGGTIALVGAVLSSLLVVVLVLLAPPELPAHRQGAVVEEKATSDRP